MYQLTIATDEDTRTTCYPDHAQAGRALLDYAIQADLYLHGDHRTSDQLCSATHSAVITLVRLGAAGRPPSCVGTATITATATVAPTPNNLTGAAAS